MPRRHFLSCLLVKYSPCVHAAEGRVPHSLLVFFSDQLFGFIPVYLDARLQFSSFYLDRPLRSAPSTVDFPYRIATCRLQPELLLTADEAEAILSDNDADNGGGAGAGGSTNLGKTVTLTPDEESRREAKALAVLLSGDGSPVAEAMAAARRNARRASVDGAETIGDRGVGQGGRGAGKMGRTEGAAAMGVKESVQVEGKGKSTAGQKAAESALTRLAARYLVRETVRGKIPDPVANFHVRKMEWCICACI